MTHIQSNAIVERCHLGATSSIWDFCVVLDSELGENVNVSGLCFIKGATIGDNCRIGAGAFICDGVRIEKNCFIGPKVTFTNDKNPMVNDEHYATFVPEKTNVLEGARIGANATILPGITIGKYALIGAGSVVTKDVPDYEVWVGNPARRMK